MEMNSKLFRRIVCFLLSAVLALGMIPAVAPEAEATEINTLSTDSDAPVGVTVSVGSSLITISINRVGESGTATLYRVAADEYFSGDELTGKSENVVSTGTVIGEYSCGSAQEFIINRYLNDGSDNLYDKYYLVQNGTILVGPVYATEIYSMRDKEAFEHASKKGLTLEDSTTIEVAKEMGATNTVINWNLSEMIVATEDENGNPRDLSGRTDLIKYECNGKTYYFKNDYVKGQDGLISAYSKAGMNVTLVIISWAKTVTNDYPRSLMYFNQTNRQTLAYNTSNERGMEYWIAAMEFLADRYSKSANMGLVQKFIIGNEIDYTYDWYLIQPLEGPDGLPQRADFDVFMEEYARTLRLANLAVKKYNSSAKVLVSLTHNWAESCYEAYRSPRTSVRYNSYAPKDIVDWLVEVEGARGDYNWGLAVHPYAIGTNPSNPLKTDPTGLNGQYSPTTGDPDETAWITVSNLEVYQLYLQRPENLYNGEELRTVSLTETTVLSQNSASAGYQTSVLEQAASIAMTYYRAANVPCIDQIAYFQLHDQTTTTYMVGLMTSDGVKKPAYDVWKYIDTDKSFIYANKYLKYISSTAQSYKDLMDVVESDFDWDTMWSEDNIIYRTVEGGDSVRNLSTSQTNYNADEMILVTATGDWGDTVELFLGSDDISTAEPLYTYPVMGTQNGTTYRSGGTYDILAYGEIGMSRLEDAVLKAGTYKVVLRRGDTGETLVKQINIKGDYSMGSTALSVSTDKSVYASGEDIIVYATGNTDCWVGLYKKTDVPKNVTSIFWYYNNEPAAGQISGKPTILQNGIHNTDSSNPSMILAPGEYVLYLFDGSGGNAYNAVMSTDLTITEAVIEGLTGVEYKLEDPTDGFANGVVTVTKDADNINAVNCVMVWADANGEPLEGYTALGQFKLEGTRTVYQMPTHMIIPAEAKMLLAYASDGNTLSKEAVSVALPENAGYVIDEEPIVEFQVVSDIHVTTDAGATNEVKYSNTHFTMMLEDVQANSPDSIGIIINGDIANTGAKAEYQKVLSLYYATKNNGQGDLPELHLSIGNHDWYSGNPNKQFQYYVSMFNSNLSKQPETVYYDEVINGYHFIYLGGEKSGLRAYISDEQLAWFDNLMAEITAEDPDKPVFVFLHQSFYNTVAGSLPGQGWDGVVDEEKLKAVMEKYGQIVLANGHSHWELNSDSNMYAGDTSAPVAFNTASVSYLWTSYNVMGGEHLDGSHGYYYRVYDDKIVVLGRDFENQKFVSSACYVVQRNDIQDVEDEYTISVYQSAVNLGATSLSGDAVHYASSNNDIASITDDGTIIAKKAGTVEITISADSTDTLVVAKKKVTIHVTEEKETFQVIFKDWDGTILSDKIYEYGDTVKVPADPNRISDNPAAYAWVFTGWDKPVTACQGNTVYTAQYRQDKPVYTVTFKNWDGSVISTNTYNYGDAVAVPADPTRPADLSYTYAFAGWDKTVATTCSGNATYTATYTATEKETVGLDGAVRVFGATRYDTAFEAADMLKELQGVEKFQTIVVACGTDFADALSGSYLANQKNAPILLVRNRNQEIDQVKDYIRENLAPGGTVYLLGGTNAIPATMETGLEGFTVKRLAGATRYETNLEILKEAGVGDKDILVCTGKNFADGLSASAVNMPILLVKDSLSSSQKEFLNSLGGDNKIYIIGGTNAVNKSIANTLATYGATERIEGATRYETSVNIAKKFFTDTDCVVLAYGNNFPDGLSGGPLAYMLEAPLILTADGKDSAAVAYANGAAIDSGVVLGGTGLISDKVVRKICQLDANAEIPVV